MTQIKFLCELDAQDYLEVISEEENDLIGIYINKKILQDECDIEETLSVLLNCNDVKALINLLNDMVNKIEGGKE